MYTYPRLLKKKAQDPRKNTGNWEHDLSVLSGSSGPGPTHGCGYNPVVRTHL